jgi:transcription initiation factor IIE alpha subunit
MGKMKSRQLTEVEVQDLITKCKERLSEYKNYKGAEPHVEKIKDQINRLETEKVHYIYFKQEKKK